MIGILEMIGAIEIISNPEKYKELMEILNKNCACKEEHGYYLQRTGEKYEGSVYIHGNNSPFTDGHGNVVIWK